jgi:hypothetical protein
VVKGLAKHVNRLRHVLLNKCVDASLFNAKRGYSPMTRIILTGACGCLHWVESVCTASARPVIPVRSSADHLRGMSSARYRKYSGLRSLSLLNDR